MYRYPYTFYANSKEAEIKEEVLEYKERTPLDKAFYCWKCYNANPPIINNQMVMDCGHQIHVKCLKQYVRESLSRKSKCGYCGEESIAGQEYFDRINSKQMDWIRKEEQLQKEIDQFVCIIKYREAGGRTDANGDVLDHQLFEKAKIQMLEEKQKDKDKEKKRIAESIQRQKRKTTKYLIATPRSDDNDISKHSSKKKKKFRLNFERHSLKLKNPQQKKIMSAQQRQPSVTAYIQQEGANHNDVKEPESERKAQNEQQQNTIIDYYKQLSSEELFKYDQRPNVPKYEWSHAPEPRQGSWQIVQSQVDYIDVKDVPRIFDHIQYFIITDGPPARSGWRFKIKYKRNRPEFVKLYNIFVYPFNISKSNPPRTWKAKKHWSDPTLNMRSIIYDHHGRRIGNIKKDGIFQYEGPRIHQIRNGKDVDVCVTFYMKDWHEADPTFMIDNYDKHGFEKEPKMEQMFLTGWGHCGQFIFRNDHKVNTWVPTDKWQKILDLREKCQQINARERRNWSRKLEQEEQKKDSLTREIYLNQHQCKKVASSNENDMSKQQKKEKMEQQREEMQQAMIDGNQQIKQMKQNMMQQMQSLDVQMKTQELILAQKMQQQQQQMMKMFQRKMQQQQRQMQQQFNKERELAKRVTQDITNLQQRLQKFRNDTVNIQNDVLLNDEDVKNNDVNVDGSHQKTNVNNTKNVEKDSLQQEPKVATTIERIIQKADDESIQKK